MKSVEDIRYEVRATLRWAVNLAFDLFAKRKTFLYRCEYCNRRTSMNKAMIHTGQVYPSACGRCAVVIGLWTAREATDEERKTLTPLPRPW